MRLEWLAAALTVMVSGSACAQGNVEGLITARAGKGFWARFPAPVSAGQNARIRAFRESQVLGTARVEWTSATAPFEAYLTDARVVAVPELSARTPYQVLFGERPVAGHEAAPPMLTPGMHVEVEGRAAEPAGDALAQTIRQLQERPDFRAALESGGRGAARRTAAQVVQDPRRTWNDPVIARLVERARDLLAARGQMGGQAPAHWFTVAESRTQRTESGPSDRR